MKKALFILSCSAILASCAHSAILTGSVDDDPATSTNLTTDGTIDWAIWNHSSGSAVSLDVTNTKSGGAGLVSAITAFSNDAEPAGNVRGVGSVSQLYSYTNGTSPTTLTNTTQGFVANSTLGTAGLGVQFTITGDASQTYQVDIWTIGYNGQGELQANLTNASELTIASGAFGAKTPNLFSLQFRPDDDSDQLSISFHLLAEGINHPSAHVGFQAVSIRAVPEPASYALLLGALGLGIAAIRRPRKDTARVA